MPTEDKKLNVLLVEDEATLMQVVGESIAQLGHTVTHRAEGLEDALARATEGGFDVAMLDVNLNGADSFAVADVLTERGIPFVFTTGFGADHLPERFRASPLMEKPFRLRDIGNALSRMAESV